jgi:NAD(P)-dependent dehydrogenase (short-subunit alcohol dehydrogenase family)
MYRASDISSRTALITGAGKRIGRAVALRLAREGFDIIIHANKSKQEAESAAAAIRKLHVKSWVLTSDLSDPLQAQNLVARAIKTAGRLDCLVNNASIFEPSRLNDFTLDQLINNIQLNAFAPLLLGRAFAKQKRSGALVNFLDARVVAYDKAHAAYHLSKRMLLTLTRMMALSFAPRIRVNAIAPGPILPPPGKNREYLKRVAAENPLGRTGSTEDIAEAVLFLLKSTFITGQILYVDGGYHMKGRTYE